MDEAEKYKQRLEAIAEKRRLQEEQERARREMEDERLRVQQLKRKSLRDQWLMEGAPLSPTSLDTLSSRSPPWGSQDNQHTEKLSESQQLAEDKLKVQMDDGQTAKYRNVCVNSLDKGELSVPKTETLAEAEKEVAQNDMVQNGTVLESSEDEVKSTQSVHLNKSGIFLTNGTKDLELNTNHSDSKPSAQFTSTNGPVCMTEGVVMTLEPGLGLGVSEAGPGQAPNATVNEEDDEEAVVMRAERVIITDEGDDVSEKATPQEGREDGARPEVSPLQKPEDRQQEEAPVEGVTAHTEQSESPGATTEAQPDDMNTNGNAGGETKGDGQNKPSASTATAAPVPDRSERPPEAEREAAAAAQDPAALPAQFQEVPLTDAEGNQKADASAGEQEPLLLQTRAQVVQEAANIPAGTETRSGEQAKAAGHKSCQCCSVM